MFARLASDSGGLDRIRDPRSYLLKATRNAAYGILRARRRRERLAQDPALQIAAAPETRPARDGGDIMAAFAALPPEQREVLALKIAGGLTFKEIARLVGRSQNMVSSRYRYGIERLRAALGVSDGGN